jgi:HEAT repeat protein
MVRGTSVVLDDGAIARKARDVLAGSGIFFAAEGNDQKPSRADVAITSEILVDDASRDADVGIKVRLKIEPHPSTTVTVRYAEDTTALGQAPLGETAVAELVPAFQRLAERTTEDLLRAYVARQKLWFAAEPALAQALLSGDADLRVEALRIVGARKLKTQLTAVIRLLSDSDEATRDAALGAVVAMGERSAIKALADSRQMRDSYEMSKVVDAVASLGGQEAREYLSFVAETHDDPDIRKMAEAALARLKTREAKSAPTK